MEFLDFYLFTDLPAGMSAEARRAKGEAEAVSRRSGYAAEAQAGGSISDNQRQ